MNQQPIEKSVSLDALDVHSIFHTVQGEGPFAGQRAVFVRLAGCNLQCPVCDTDYTSKRALFTPNELRLAIKLRAPQTNLVVITGGEPLRQKLVHHVGDLLYAGYTVQIETNGTLFQRDLPFYEDGERTNFHIVCSPKTPSIASMLVPYIDAFKYIVQAGKVLEDGLPSTSLGMAGSPFRPPQDFDRTKIYVQPCDEQDPIINKANMDQAVQSCMDHGYTLSLQMHKIAELP